MKYLRLYFMNKNVFIDTTEKRLVDNLKIPFELSDKTYNQKLKAMSKSILGLGSYVYSSDDEFGLGRVTKFFDSDDSLMLVHFNERELPTMCSRNNLTTIHDDVDRKLKLIY